MVELYVDRILSRPDRSRRFEALELVPVPPRPLLDDESLRAGGLLQAVQLVSEGTRVERLCAIRHTEVEDCHPVADVVDLPRVESEQRAALAELHVPGELSAVTVELHCPSTEVIPVGLDHRSTSPCCRIGFSTPWLRTNAIPALGGESVPSDDSNRLSRSPTHHTGPWTGSQEALTSIGPSRSPHPLSEERNAYRCSVHRHVTTLRL